MRSLVSEIDRVWADHFLDPWPEYLDDFNRLVGDKQDVRFWLPNRFCSPAWVNGDPRLMKPGNWVLVVSLNPHIDPGDNRLEARTDYSSREWQEFWERFNSTREHWKGGCFPRLGQLASRCLGLDLNREEINEFVHRNMLFIEFCPYASQQLPDLTWARWKHLARLDPAIRISRFVRQLLFDHGEPALVLCNGKFATYDVKDQQFGVDGMRLDLLPAGGKSVSLYTGLYTPSSGEPFPVVGFNQLGRQFSSPTTEMDAIVRKVGEMRHETD